MMVIPNYKRFAQRIFCICRNHSKHDLDPVEDNYFTRFLTEYYRKRPAYESMDENIPP